MQNKLIVILIIILTVVLIFTYYDRSLLNSKRQTNFIESQKQAQKCEPIMKNDIRQFSVVVDSITYPKRIPIYQNRSYNFTCLNESKKPKVILFWNTWFGDETFDFGLGKYVPFIKNKCPVTNCELTNEKARLNDSQFVVFHMRDSIQYLPQTRQPAQRWIFLLYESPVHSSDFSQYNGLFNLSATYKRDSDIFGTAYRTANIKWDMNDNFDVTQDFHQNKPNLAFMIVSNCKAKSDRLGYVKELQKYIQVDVYGKCGQPCPIKYDNGTIGECKRILSQKYKFIFAFENSFCEDYITEKLFQTVHYPIVPVVYGMGPYDEHLPTSAYISVLDFKTPMDLAKYLLYLHSNRTAYNSYFIWRRYIKYDSSIRSMRSYLCEMCIQLNLDEYFGIKKKIIKDMNKFWNKTTQCKRPKLTESLFELLTY